MELEPSLSERPLKIAIFACCSGEEAYSLAYVLRRHFPQLAYEIRGFDLVEHVIPAARAATYTREQVHAGPFVTESFVEELFDVEGDQYRVKPEYRKGITFDVGDMTNPEFVGSLDRCDLVFAQNVLFHLPPKIAPIAFENIYRLLQPHASMFINGMDGKMRIKLTKKFQLEPVQYLLQEIHEDARIDRGGSWASQYWGREPFSKSSRDWVRKFGTIFTRGA